VYINLRMVSFRNRGFYYLSGLIILAGVSYILFQKYGRQNLSIARADSTSIVNGWQPPDTNSIPFSEAGNLIRYGKNLVANTSYYLGPKGTVASISNGMNCQNCHLNAGMIPFANCFSAVASIYPVFRPRSGIVESIEFRINDCLQRSLNGKTIDSMSKEMRAMVAYLTWVGKGVAKGTKPKGAGTEELVFMTRAADPKKGKLVYFARCQSCHGRNGEGMFQPDSAAFIYPPLWGPHSYNTGAGLYRITKFAGYVKNAMPLGSTYEKPQLSDEEAWNVAAFVNSQPRPVKVFSHDWPDLSLKAIDHPYAPYADTFSEQQHKYGPFGPIKKAKDKLKTEK
jgi:thiosulfate dehydrogenase